MRVPVLTYHGLNMDGHDYADNDHVAFAEDLRLLQAEGMRIVPLDWVVEQRLGRAERDLEHCVALTCDDGSNFDYFDLDHPTLGPQRSLHNLMGDFQRAAGFDAQPSLHLTCFAIASPEAREALDGAGLGNHGWMADHWWRAAERSGRMSFANHSWDHNHPVLESPGPFGMPRGSFLDVDSLERADYQIAQAQRYLDEKLGPRRVPVFCYPFGHVSEYLRGEYFPQYGDRHGVVAAFCDGGQSVTLDSDVWRLPRFICGHDWHSPDELLHLLRDAAG